MRIVPMGLAVIVAMVLGGIAFAVYTGRAQAPDIPAGAPGVDVSAALGRFSQRHALARLEERIRDICASAHPAALAQELNRIRRTVATLREDHWRLDLIGSDWLYADVYPDGTVGGTLLDLATRECGR